MSKKVNLINYVVKLAATGTYLNYDSVFGFRICRLIFL